MSSLGTTWSKWPDPIERRAHHNSRMKEWRTRDDNGHWSDFRRSLRKKGITLDQYAAKEENQDWLCDICKSDVAQLVIDHNHRTGKFRGLLCSACNTGIGLLRESAAIMDASKEYLVKYA